MPPPCGGPGAWGKRGYRIAIDLFGYRCQASRPAAVAVPGMRGAAARSLAACLAACVCMQLAAAAGPLRLRLYPRSHAAHEVESFLQFIDDFHMGDWFSNTTEVEAPKTVKTTLALQNWANVRAARPLRPIAPRAGPRALRRT